MALKVTVIFFLCVCACVYVHHYCNHGCYLKGVPVKKKNFIVKHQQAVAETGALLSSFLKATSAGST